MNAISPYMKVAHMNRRVLGEIAMWAKNEEEICSIFDGVNPSMVKKTKEQMNRESVRRTMMVLADQALVSDGVETETFSLRSLANTLDAPRSESMQRTLRNWLLPLLSNAGWIEGFITTEEWSSTPHEIGITSKGIRAMIDYFEKCAQLTTVVLD